MPSLKSVFILCLVSCGFAHGAAQVPNFPEASQATGMALDVLSDGRILAWDGADLILEKETGADFDAVAQLSGAPAFVSATANGLKALLGAGAAVYDNGAVYRIDFEADPIAIESVISVGAHHWGDLLDDNTLLIGREDGAAAQEIVLVGLDAETPAAVPVVTGLPGAAAKFAVDQAGGHLYAGTDLGEAGAEVRRFDLADLLDAAAGDPVDWASGAPLSGDFENGGPCAVTDNGLLVIGGPNGVLQFVNKTNFLEIDRMDPAEQGWGNYVAAYDPMRDQVLALSETGGQFKLWLVIPPTNCFLNNLRFATPVQNATWYASAGAGSFNMDLTIASDCQQDIAYVDFYIVPPGEFLPLLIGRDTEFPFEASQRVSGTGTDATISFIAEATSISGAVPQVSTEIDVFMRGADGSRGLPANPFTTLKNPGDRWIDDHTFSGAQYPMTSAAAVLFGYDPDNPEDDPEYDPADNEHGFNDITIELTNKEDANQRVTVTASEYLLRDDEMGMLVVQMAPDLLSLMGLEQSTAVGAEPSGDFEGDGVYIEISFLVSDDGGATYNEISTSRLAQHPIQLTISGQPLVNTSAYRLLSHPTIAADNGSGLEILAGSGAWRSVPGFTYDPVSGDFQAELTSLSLIAPFEGAPEGGFPGDGSLSNLILILLSGLGIVNLAGGEGGSPCFIATAAYGTPLAADIDALRQFRDACLLANPAGSALVDAYYRVSPAIAEVVAGNAFLAALVRILLMPALFITKQPVLSAAALALICYRACMKRLRKA